MLPNQRAFGNRVVRGWFNRPPEVPEMISLEELIDQEDPVEVPDSEMVSEFERRLLQTQRRR